jgi:hypothetical protein
LNRVRRNVFLEREHARRLDELATMKNVSKSSIVAAALAAFLSPDSADKREAGIVRRLDKLTRQFDCLDRDQTILIETVALFIRHQLSMAAPVPEALQPVVRAQGRARFGLFIEQLVQHLQRGGSLVRQVSEEIAPESAQRPLGDTRTAEERSVP